MKTTTKLKLAWKYRRPLWKYRNVLRHRYDIAAVAATGLVMAFSWMLTKQ